MELLAASWDFRRTVGLGQIQVQPGDQQAEIACVLIGEALRQLSDKGFASVDGQAGQHDTDTQRLFAALEIPQIDTGLLLCK